MTQTGREAARPSKWKRITLLSILGLEGAGGLSGGILLALEPDGRLMEMPTSIMHGVFDDFLIPGIMLIALGALNAAAFVAVLRRTRSDWIMALLAMGGLTVWFGIEIAVLEELHWLHVTWGLPVIVGDLLALPLVPPHYATIRKSLLVCGILSSFLYLLAIRLGAMRWEGYDPASQTVSELIGIDAPSAPLVIPLFLVYSLLIFAFGLGVWKSAGPRRTLRIAAILIIMKEVLGVFGTIFAPMHMRGIEGTATDSAHVILTAVGVLLCMFPAIGFAATSFGKGFRLYSIVTMVVFLVFGILTGLEAPQLEANLPTPWMGVWERINIIAYMIWIAVLAILLLREEENSKTR